MRGLDGKIAVVSGGATLIGAAVVRDLHERGVRVGVADIDAEGGERLVQELGDGVLFVPTDIREDDAIARLVTAIHERFGGIDFLVNLATTYVDEGFASSREVPMRRPADQLVSSRFALPGVRSTRMSKKWP